MKEDYFETIDTPQKAYWLGFLITDGSVKNNRVFLGLALKDECIIDKFISELDIDPIRKRHYTHIIKKKEYFSVNASLVSKKMVQDLKKYNVVPRKTFISIFPDLGSEELNFALLSGCFDGDGCWGSSVICSGNILFLNQIKKMFNIKYPIKHKNKNVYTLTIGVDLLYKAQQIFSLIERKKIYGLEYKDNLFKCGKNKKKNHQPKLDINTKYQFWLDENDITILDLRNLVDSTGLESLGKKFNCSGNKIKSICKHFKIELPDLQTRSLQLRKVNRPNSQELNALIKKHSYVQLGKMFGVSDNAVRKWAKIYGLL